MIKAIFRINKLREFAEKKSIGSYGCSFNLEWHDGIGKWFAYINMPFPKGEKLAHEKIEGIGSTWWEAVNNLYEKTR